MDESQFRYLRLLAKQYPSIRAAAPGRRAARRMSLAGDIQRAPLPARPSAGDGPAPGGPDDEVDASLAGDDIIPHPMVETTHAITIAAPPSAVWPWLIQGGYRGAGRAGWYSDGWFNWLVEGGFLRITVPAESLHEQPGVASANEILPAFQHTAVGDIVPDGPPGSAQFVVKVIDPERAWVIYSDTHIKYLTPTSLHGTRWTSHGDFTWVFVLQPIGEQGTRLILRTRARFGPRLRRPILVPLFYLGEAIIPRMTLRGIKTRAERVTAL